MEITASDEIYNRYSMQARRRYDEEFTKERMLREYERVYASLA